MKVAFFSASRRCGIAGHTYLPPSHRNDLGAVLAAVSFVLDDHDIGSVGQQRMFVLPSFNRANFFAPW